MTDLFALVRCTSLADAIVLGESIPTGTYTYWAGMGYSASDDCAVIQTLRARFPAWTWRVALSRTGYRSAWMITPLAHADDPREHYDADTLLPAMRAFCALAEVERVAGRVVPPTILARMRRNPSRCHSRNFGFECSRSARAK